MIEFKNEIIGYSNKVNRNGCIILKKELKNCIKSQYLPIVDDFNNRKLIGMTTNIKIKDNKLMIDGYLLRKKT